jgi:hypothetical protein
MLALLICLSGTLGGCAAIEAFTDIEEPQYRVLRSDGAFELRAYPALVIAETSVEGELIAASNRGFRPIADYIFGNNLAAAGGAEKIAMTAPVTVERAGEKIAMTAPVTVERGPSGDAGKKWRMHFVMPSKYTLATLPRPVNPAVTLREVPPRKVAAVRFSGFSGEAVVAEQEEALRLWLTRNGLEATGAVQIARYNPPITPPMFRRNEVLIPVR